MTEKKTGQAADLAGEEVNKNEASSTLCNSQAQAHAHATEEQRWRAVKAHIAKGDKAKEKAEQHYIAAGQYLAELKAAHTGTWAEWEAKVKEKAGIGKSRASELMQIADGRKTVTEVRAEQAEHMREHRAKQRAISPARAGETATAVKRQDAPIGAPSQSETAAARTDVVGSSVSTEEISKESADKFARHRGATESAAEGCPNNGLCPECNGLGKVVNIDRLASRLIGLDREAANALHFLLWEEPRGWEHKLMCELGRGLGLVGYADEEEADDAASSDVKQITVVVLPPATPTAPDPDDGNDMPTFLRRGHPDCTIGKAGAVATTTAPAGADSAERPFNPYAAEQKAASKEKGKIRIAKMKAAQGVKEADLAGKRRRMPLTGKAALDAIRQASGGDPS
jgi:hypothetical protein